MRIVPVVYRRLATAVVLGCVLCGCQTSEAPLPSQTGADDGRFDSYDEVHQAYERIQPGKTATRDLAALGFDIDERSNVEVLSYLGLIERARPRESVRAGDLDPSVRPCLQSRAECTAFIFRPQFIQKHRIGNVPPDVLGFKRTIQQNGWSAEVLLVIRDEHVIYKLWADRPHATAPGRP